MARLRKTSSGAAGSRSESNVSGGPEIKNFVLANTIRDPRTKGIELRDLYILAEMLTLFVNGGRGQRFGEGVEAPTKPASRSFPYVREPNNRTDLPLPAFLRS